PALRRARLQSAAPVAQGSRDPCPARRARCLRSGRRGPAVRLRGARTRGDRTATAGRIRRVESRRRGRPVWARLVSARPRTGRLANRPANGDARSCEVVYTTSTDSTTREEPEP